MIVLAGAALYLWVLFTRPRNADMWGDVGQSVGPFVALLNAGALFAALYSVRLQRHELELQREELRGHREVMEEQRKQFERTAKAQEDLAAAEKDVAKAQKRANRLTELAIEAQNAAILVARRSADAQAEANTQARRMEHADRSGTVALLKGALATAYTMSTRQPDRDALSPFIDELKENLEAEQSIVDERGNVIYEEANGRLAERPNE